MPIDLENFEVERFKRALIDATFSEDGRYAVEAKLIVDLRAKAVTMSLDSPHLQAGRAGMALMAEYMVFTNQAYVVDTLGRPPDEMHTTGSFGIGNDKEGFLGFLHHLKQRGKTQFIYQQ